MNTETLIIHSQSMINWKSCKAISSNLMKSYGHCDNLVYHSKSKSAVKEIAQQIVNKKPTTLVFIDHLPHPGELILAIHRAYTQKSMPLPELIIHVYGDFTMSFSLWQDCEDILKQFHVRFLAASEKQKALIAKFVTNPDQILYVPFPVDISLFHFNASIRTSARRRLSIPDNQHVFLYTGRISRQKSILEMITAFSEWSLMMNPDACLYLAGEFDDFGMPYLDRLDGMNQYFSEYQEIIHSLNPEVREKIKYLGNYSTEKLSELYMAADSFISLSLHHDEDFGMSPAEAACSGLPMILTRWGGLSSFPGDHISVSMNGPSLSFSKNEVTKTLFKHIARKCNDDQRSSLSHERAEKFSIQSVSKQLQTIMNEKASLFQGFNHLLHELADLERSGVKTVFSSKNVTNHLYRKVYEAYL